MESFPYIEKDEFEKILILAHLSKLLYNVAYQNTSSLIEQLLSDSTRIWEIKC